MQGMMEREENVGIRRLQVFAKPTRGDCEPSGSLLRSSSEPSASVSTHVSLSALSSVSMGWRVGRGDSGVRCDECICGFFPFLSMSLIASPTLAGGLDGYPLSGEVEL